MATKHNMIQKAHNKLLLEEKRTQNIQTNLSEMASKNNTTSTVLVENITQVLASLANTTEHGGPIKVMNTNAISAFLAGVEAIAQALPNDQNGDRKQNTLRVLAASKIGDDGHLTNAVVPIAQLGARKDSLREKYRKLVSDYVEGQSRGAPEGAYLSSAIRKLQVAIDKAVTTATPQQNEPARAGQFTSSMPGHL